MPAEHLKSCSISSQPCTAGGRAIPKAMSSCVQGLGNGISGDIGPEVMETINCSLGLGGHPKPAIKGHFKTGQR